MVKERNTLESKYRAIVMIACLTALVCIVFIDAKYKTENQEVELGLVAVVGGLFTSESAKKIKDKLRK